MSHTQICLNVVYNTLLLTAKDNMQFKENVIQFYAAQFRSGLKCTVEIMNHLVVPVTFAGSCVYIPLVSLSYLPDFNRDNGPFVLLPSLCSVHTVVS